VVRLSPEALEINDELTERDPVLAQLAAAAVSGLPPAGPELRCRPAVQLARTDCAGPTPMGALVVQQLGFSLHAASIAGACDQTARERLLRYMLRPPLAKERLTLLPDSRVRLELKRPFRDGTYALEMGVLSLLACLAASVPPQNCIWFATVACSPPLSLGSSSWFRDCHDFSAQERRSLAARTPRTANATAARRGGGSSYFSPTSRLSPSTT
jgi:hypothetical protein